MGKCNLLTSLPFKGLSKHLKTEQWNELYICPDSGENKCSGVPIRKYVTHTQTWCADNLATRHQKLTISPWAVKLSWI